jgi:peroxiredoxin
LCEDVEIKKYLQKRQIKNDEIKIAVISEALPKDMNNYFDAEGTPQFITNTNFIFNRGVRHRK